MTANIRLETRELEGQMPQKIEWLWPNRIPYGKISMIAGDPGVGKTFLSLDIVARHSTGRPWPDIPDVMSPVGETLLITAEDDPLDTILPRLMGMGADLSRVRTVGDMIIGTEEYNVKQFFNLKDGRGVLERLLQENPRLKLVVIDPIEAYMGDINTFKNSEVRAVLDPIAEIAARYRVAILMIHHLNKGEGRRAVHRIMGSLGYTAVARIVWLVVRNKEDRALVEFVPIKVNICKDVYGLAYRFQTTRVKGADGEDIETAILSFEDAPVYESADDLLLETAIDDMESTRHKAAEWLREFLGGGPQLTAEVFLAGKEVGFKEKTLRRVKKEMGIPAFQMKDGDGKICWWWGLEKP